MNIISTIITALTTHFEQGAMNIMVTFPAMFVQGILTLADDEKSIFAKALNTLLADVKSGKGWEVAFTDCLNTFYSGEASEGSKIAMAVLEYLAKAVGSL